MTKTFKPARPIWCAGCGDFGVLQALENAMKELKIDAHDTLVVARCRRGPRSAFVRRHFHVDWADAALYHATFNAQLTSVTTASEMMIAGARAHERYEELSTRVPQRQPLAEVLERT